MNYGFVINNDSCIGCHACSTACKSENEVPLGVQRTWVKSVEKGVYPNVRRTFQVTRCNHCANPPCVRICPVTAMYQRQDGIVEFDPDVCIGCKACMQACPYDAIYIDPETHTAAKCHFCAHRVEVGLEPACVVVCPEHAILAGDLDNPDTEIARVLAENKVTVRKPEQGTAPKLFYIGGDDAAMHPTATDRTPTTFAWADVLELESGAVKNGGDGAAGRPPHSGASSGATGYSGATSKSGTPIRTPGTQGLPSGGPIMIGDGRMAEQMVQVVYNAQHKVPWHWPVPAYLVTKGIAAGLFLLAALGLAFGWVTATPVVLAGAAVATVVFLLATTALLVYDLERPERFLSIVFRPQWKSWLVRGAFLLIGFSGLATLWAAGEVAAWQGWLDPDLASAWRPWLLGVGSPLAIGTAVYTAFLFSQAEGRDLWQNSLLPFHLIVHSFVAGAATLVAVGAATGLGSDWMNLGWIALSIALVVDLVVTIFGEVGMSHASEAAAKAAHEITHGRYARSFWWGSIGLGHVLPLAVALAFFFVPVAEPWTAVAGIVAGLSALIGLYLYEHAFVMAPQDIPNS